jgi:hypothetical protein
MNSGIRLFPLGTAVALLTISFCSHAETIRLFNGTDLTNFYTFLKDKGRNVDPNLVFTVKDGVIRISGEEYGCITSNEEFENYHLVCEFKWGEKTWGNRENAARDSGILVHSMGEDGGYSGIWMFGIECQMIEGGTGDFLVVGDKSSTYSLTASVAPERQGSSFIYQDGGKAETITSGRINWWGRAPEWEDKKGFRGAKDVEKPLGEWNTLECIADGAAITVKLNGVVVNKCFDVHPRKGRIQVQSEGAEVFVRRLELTPLKEKHARKERFIYNSDADNMLIYKGPPMKPEDLNAYIDEIAGTGVTTFSMSPNIGMKVNFPGTVNEMNGTFASEALAKKFANGVETKRGTTERAIQNIQGFLDAGLDPLELIFSHAREKGLETFISFRLNEVHAVDEDDSLILSKFWKEHPEWRVAPKGSPPSAIHSAIIGPDVHPIVGSWFWGAMNFAIPEVRDHRLAELRECCERYDADGLELDFQRFPVYFPYGEEAANLDTMTAWMRDVRAMTNEITSKRGKPMLLSVRVLARPEQCLALGLDVPRWAAEGLVDFVIASHYLRNDFPLPVSQYRAILPIEMPLYASIEVEREPDMYRRLARQLWGDGADGIMLFNFFTTRESGKEPPMGLLKELGSPETIAPDEHPGRMRYPKVNLANGYVVDPSWPKRPDTMKWRFMTGVAVDKLDQVWTLNALDPPVQVYDHAGNLVTSWGSGEFKNPHFLRIDVDGNIWTADFGRHIVRKHSPKGENLSTLGTPDVPGDGETHLNMPTDMAVAADGSVFVTDGYGNNRVVHYDHEGKFIGSWGRMGVGPGELSQPHAIAIDSKGLVYVCERNNCRIQIFEQSGNPVGEWRNIVNPWAIWISPSDEIYVFGSTPARWVNRGNLGNPPSDQILIKFDRDGRVQEQWAFPLVQDAKWSPGQLDWGHGLGVDSKGNIYIGDVADESPEHRVQKFIRLNADR